MNIVAAANPIGRLGRVGGVLGKAFRWARRGSKSSHIIGTAAEHLFKILPYRKAQKLTRGFKGEIQAHHILEVRHATRWGLKADDVPAVILPKNVHDEVTLALRTKLPYLGAGRRYDKQEVWQAYQEVYRNYPEWLSVIEKYFR
jgi:uncharacterized membrane protein (UPF0136 family)